MAPNRGNDALASTSGLMPRYMRASNIAAAPADPPVDVAPCPAQDPHEFLLALRTVDAATQDLRRRVAASSRKARRSSLVVAVPALAGLAMMVGFLGTH